MNRSSIYESFFLRFFKNNNILKAIFFISATVSLASYIAIISWRKWPDILIDFGRELYIPWQLAQGAVLYQDIAYFNGPFSPYLNSIIFKIFGYDLSPIIICNLVIALSIALLLFYTFKKIADILNSTVIICVFLSIFAFSQYLIIGNFNFITPYSHELTHGIFISIWTIFCFLSYFERRTPFWLVNIGISIGLTFLTKPEVFLAIFISIAVGFFWLIIIERPSYHQNIKTFSILTISFLSPIFFFWGFLNENVSMERSIFFILSPYFNLFKSSLYSSPYYLWVTGTNTPLANFKKLTFSLFWIALGFSLFVISPLFVLKNIRNNKLKMLVTLLIFLIFLFSIPYFRTPYLINLIPWMDLLRPLPLFAIGIILFTSIRLRYYLSSKRISLNILFIHVFAWFSFILLLKIFLKATVYHYGFALAMPATLLSIYIMMSYLTNRVGEYFQNHFATRLFSILMIIVFSFVHVDLSSSLYKLKAFKVGDGQNKMVTWIPEVSEKGPIFNQALESIESIIKKEQTFIALPEGVMLNFLTKRKNPTPYINFMPPELIIFGEDEIVDSFKRYSPDFFIFIDKDTSVYGYKYFGKDYGTKIYQWVLVNYKELMTIGHEPFSGKGFGIKILKRIDRPLKS